MNKVKRQVFARVPIIIMASLGLSACTSLANPFVGRDAPTISHIHIGHAITGWPQAPNKQGLLVAAELGAISAAATSELMLRAARDGDMDRARKYLNDVANAVDPGFLTGIPSNVYGLRKAAAEAITHLQLASEVEDASANVQRTVAANVVKAHDLIDRSDELLAFLDAGKKAQSVEVMEIIAEEIVRTLKRIAGGPDAKDSYSLYNFREDIEAMVEREDPPYKTVESFYLFNLIKLPDGEWGFASRSSRGTAGAGY
ncbi:MAG: hypothetical protein ACI9UN_003096 [Granulosicoccus sp.]|jgi:hypothetical protein